MDRERAVARGIERKDALTNATGSGQRALRIRDWDLGYAVDLPGKKVTAELSDT